MTRTRRLAFAHTLSAAALAVALVVPLAGALAQSQNGNFLDNLFSRGDGRRDEGRGQPPKVAQADDGEVASRLDRIENALRQLTGTVEQLQYRNQQLELQLSRLQAGQGYAAPPGARGGEAQPPQYGGAPAPQYNPQPQYNAPPAAARPGPRSDVFDPSQHPNAPGTPHALGGSEAAIIATEPETPIGAPGGRDAGAPLDLSTLAGNGTAPPPASSMPADMPRQSSQLPPPPPRNPSATGPQLATLPPSARPQDEYDMAYGYVLHKDYSLAEQAFRDFLRKYPNEHLIPDAQYWLGESLYQQQRYRDAAESFLAVSTKFEHAGKAPDALLRLGQSLAALDKKEAACATLAEVGRKYPKASASVKRSVAQEQKRVHC